MRLIKRTIAESESSNKTNINSRESGSSIQKPDNKNVKDNITHYVEKRVKAIEHSKQAGFPPLNLSKQVLSIYGTSTLFYYKNLYFNSMKTPTETIRRNILLLGDRHEYVDKKSCTFLLDWIVGMCNAHPTKKLTLLVEHPDKKKINPTFKRKNIRSDIEWAKKYYHSQGQLFGIMWKLRKKINFKNFTSIGIDPRTHESGGLLLPVYIYNEKDLVSLKLSQRNLLLFFIQLCRNPLKTWKHKNANDETEKFRIRTLKYFLNVSTIIKDALNKSIFKNSTTLFYKMLYKSLYKRLQKDIIITDADDAISSETVVMDAYCLAVLFDINGDNNVIINVGNFHTDTYNLFLTQCGKKTKFFRLTNDDCVAFDRPFDFLA